MEQWAAGPATRRRPVAPWVRRNKFLVALIAVLLAALVVGVVVSLSGEKTASRPSAATLPPVTKGAKWVTGSAGTQLATVNTDLGKVGAAQRAGQHSAAEGAGAQLAVDARAALSGQMPPADATLYRAGLTDLAKAGTDISNGNARTATALLATGNSDVAMVTAAANSPAPSQVTGGNGQRAGATRPLPAGKAGTHQKR
jgi:hypothetical protein